MVCALGTGLNTVIFTVAYGILVRPLPYRDAGRLATVRSGVPLSTLSEWRHRLSTFERVGAYSRQGVTIRGLDEPRFCLLYTSPSPRD